MSNLDPKPSNNVSEGMNDEEDKGNFESMVTAKKAASSGLRGKLQVVLRVREGGGEAVRTATVELAELACEGIEAKCHSATLSKRYTDIEVEFVETSSVETTMRGQLAGSERGVRTLTPQLGEAQLAHEKLTGGSSKTEADLWAQEVVVEDALNVKRARVERLKRNVMAEAKRGNSCCTNVERRTGQRAHGWWMMGSRFRSYSSK